LSARGKLIRRTPGFRHLLSAKSTKQKRRATKDKLVAEGHAKPLLRCLPFGL
jgi:large subunit ribosomal protein L35